MEIVEVYFELGHTPTLKKWRHSYMEIVQAHFQLMHTFTKKVEAFLYGNCVGTFSVNAYLH